MSIFENILSAISNVFSNKTRTFLTMIGIIIGVSSVITITSLGEGLKDTIKNAFSIFNFNAIQVMTNWGAELGSKDKIFLDDIEGIKNLDNVKYSAGYVQSIGNVALKNPNEHEFLSIIGSDVDFSIMQKNFFKTTYGRVFSEQENKNKAKVCLINEKTAFKIFGRKNVVDEEIEINIKGKDYKFKIIGVTDGKDIEAIVGDVIHIPINTILDIFNSKTLDLIYVELHDLKLLDKTTKQINRILAANHNTTDDKYMSIANIEQIKTVDKTINLFTAFIGFVAAISLLVGGIGIMNIMLVTVTERTREIGIRKSLGATNNNIKTQFLIEAMFICVLGGIIGIFVGFTASIIIGKLLEGFFQAQTGLEPLPPVLSMPVAIGTMIISTMIGVIFGVYPAGKAAKLDPIEALRYE